MLDKLSPFVHVQLSIVLAGISLVIISWPSPVVVPILLAAYITALSWPSFT